jgi:hypothetical protein
VVLLASAVHLVRRNLVDLAVFLGVAALMVLEPRVRRPSRGRPAWLDRRALAGTVAAALAVLVWVPGRSSPVVQAALALVGLVALGLLLRAGPRRSGPTPRPAAPRWWVWAALLLAGSGLELANFLSQRDAQTDNLDHPTLSTVVEPMLAGPWPRAGAAAVWLLVGWWLVREATQRDRVDGGDGGGLR